MTDLLLLHGAIGSSDQLHPLSKELSGNFRVHAIDFIGHGSNSADVRFSIPLFAAEVLKWMEVNSLSRIDIFGYSMGGYVALYLARHHPGKVGRIFTLGTKFNWTPETAMAETKMVDPVRIEAKLPDFARLLAIRHAPGDWKLVLARTAEMMIDLGNGAAMNDADWQSIQCSVMLSVGDKDRMVSLEETSAVHRAIAGSRLLVLPETPHPIEQTNVQLLASYITRFFGL